MLDIGGWEFLIVAFVLIMVVGPKELPKMLRGFTRITRQVRLMASEFSRGMQTMADEAELGDIKGAIDDVKRGNLSGVADAIDPGGELKDSIKDVEASARETALLGDVGKIKDSADITGDSLVEKVNGPSSADDPVTSADDPGNKQPGDTNAKTRS